MIDESDTYCGKCIKADVCGMEGVYDPAMTYCAYRVTDRLNGTRLIDVDRLINDFKHSKAISFAERMKFSNVVEHQPIITIPTAELDTANDFAEWIDVNGDGSIMKCSRCGEEVCCKDNNFCSNCGAAMRTKESKTEKLGPCMTCECIDDSTGRCLVDHYCEEYIHWKEGDENG